jgi:LysM repeat protein
MSDIVHRTLAFGVSGVVLIALATGCTLTGANAAPLTPVGLGTGGEVAPPPETVEPLEGTEEPLPVLPSPTADTGPIDVFGTQTAMAPPPTTEATSEPSLIEGTVEPTTEPTLEEVTPAPNVTKTPSATQASACPATHVVQPGENLFRIALKYGLTINKLAEANGITNPDQVAAGTKLKIPGCEGTGETTEEGGDILHTVQPGENLYRIALKYGLTWQKVATYNNITNPEAIFAGQVLRIPQKD